MYERNAALDTNNTHRTTTIFENPAITNIKNIGSD